MKLSDWAKQQGVSSKTAWRLYKSGKFPLPVEQLPTGTIIVHEKKPPASEEIGLYARVAPHGQKVDLNRQLQRLRDYTAAHGLRIRPPTPSPASAPLVGQLGAIPGPVETKDPRAIDEPFASW